MSIHFRCPSNCYVPNYDFTLKMMILVVVVVVVVVVIAEEEE